MNCPVCATPLQMSDRQGIEIDYCPQCRGVWLDRGELDKIIERTVALEGPLPNEPRHESRPQDYRQDYPGQSRHKKKSFWREVFDFD